MSGNTLVFDLESNGLLNDVTCIHCLVIYEQETDQTIVYNDQGDAEPITRGVQRLEDCEVMVGHNIIGYDIPCLQKIYPWFSPTALVVDTLLLSRLYHTDMLDIDTEKKLESDATASSMVGTRLRVTATGLKSTKVASVNTPTGKTGLKRCRITAYKMSTSLANYATTSTLT